MLGHKRIPSREGGIEIVVEELATRMVTLGHKVTCYIKRFLVKQEMIFLLIIDPSLAVHRHNSRVRADSSG